MTKTKQVNVRLTEEEVAELKRRGGAASVIRAALSQPFDPDIARAQTEVEKLSRRKRSRVCPHTNTRPDEKLTGVLRCLDCRQTVIRWKS